MVNISLSVGLTKIIAFQGAATALGGVGGSSLVCAGLSAVAPDFNNMQVVITGGPQKGEARIINGSTLAGTIVPDVNFTLQVPIGTQFLILSEKQPLALLQNILAIVTTIAGGTTWEPFGPPSIAIGQAVTQGVTLFDPGGGIIPSAGITAGTYTIDRIRAGALVHVVLSSASSKTNGAVYENYNYPVADGWQIGDLFIVTLTGIQITIGTTVTSLPPIQLWGQIVDEPSLQLSPDQPVNITAILASETNVFDLVTAGYNYTVEKLRLKSADPGGGNDVIVRLYENVNGVLTVVDSFTITTAGTNPFTGYYSIMDMFGLQYLTGGEVKVTVQQEVGGGPTAITGEYNYRSA